MKRTLKAGTSIYHGTDNDDFDETSSGLEGPAWVSSSASVAEYFAKRSNWGGQKRVITYRLTENLKLPEIVDRAQMERFAEKHNIDQSGVEGMRESVETADITGWILPYNYPDGDDILLKFTHMLDYVETRAI